MQSLIASVVGHEGMCGVSMDNIKVPRVLRTVSEISIRGDAVKTVSLLRRQESIRRRDMKLDSCLRRNDIDATASMRGESFRLLRQPLDTLS